MADEMLIEACRKSVKALNKINRLANKADLNDKHQLEEIQERNDKTYETVSSDIELARRSKVTTIIGCMALAKLALILQSEDLLITVAKGLIKIGHSTF